MLCLDEMGPETAKSHPGTELVKPTSRARMGIDYGRRGHGYVFGAFRPATGAAFTQPYAGRTIVNWVDFLGRTDAWVGPGPQTIFAVVDNLSAHRAIDVLLFTLAHPRWHFLFQPRYAAYLNLIEPWWKTLRSLALKGRRSRELGRDHRGRGGGHGLLERAPPLLPLGPPPPAQVPPFARRCAGASLRMNLPDAPLSRS